MAADEKDAVRLFRLAQTISTQFYLGWCYEHGKGEAVDEWEAVRLYRLSADQLIAQFHFGW